MAHLERRRNLWYALLTVPPDVRGTLGKFRFVESLGTPDKALATILVAPLLAKWKAEIREARGSTNAITEEALRWRKHLTEQVGWDKKMGDTSGMGSLELNDMLRERSEELALTKGLDVADTLHGLILGTHTPTSIKEVEWKAQLQVAPKTKDQMEKDLPLLIARFPTIEQITKSSVKKWLDDLRDKGRTPATMDRILGAARNYWKYLQTHDIVPVEATPFKGVLDLTKASEAKAKKKGKTTNLPYEGADVVKLYNSALTGWGVRPSPDKELANLIKLGAYGTKHFERKARAVEGHNQ